MNATLFARRLGANYKRISSHAHVSWYRYQHSKMSSGAQGFLDHVDASPTPFHCVLSAKKYLLKADFVEIRERDSWAQEVRPGGKYFVTRNGTSIVAFAVGRKWQPGNPVAMIGAHTDSPCLRVKPVSKKQNDGFLQVGVETYGGGLWHTCSSDPSIFYWDIVLMLGCRVRSRPQYSWTSYGQNRGWPIRSEARQDQ